MDITMTHNEFVSRSEKWLKNTIRCRVILCEFCANTAWYETPDAIGWIAGKTILVECKTSRADFFADQKKPFRNQSKLPKSLGNWRFYVTAPGLIGTHEIPDNWGLYEVRGRSVIHAGGVEYSNAGKAPFESDERGEVAMLVSALSRKSKTEIRK